MTCEEIQNHLLEVRQSFQELGAEKGGEIQSHIDGCESCHAFWKWQYPLHKILDNLPKEVPNDQLANKILIQSRHYHEKRALGFLKIFLRPQLAPVYVALFFAVALGRWLGAPVPLNGNKAEPLGAEVLLRERVLSNPLIDAWGQPSGVRNASTGSLMPETRPVAVDDTPLMEGFLEKMPIEPNLQKQYDDRKRALLEADADNLLMRGRRLKAMGRIDLALKDFETIFRFYPDYSYLGDVLMYRAQCYAFQGHVDQAIESLNTFIEKYPSRKSLVLPMIDQLKMSGHD